MKNFSGNTLSAFNCCFPFQSETESRSSGCNISYTCNDENHGCLQKARYRLQFFDAGILISIGSLFYANLIWFVILLFVGIVMLRTVNFSEIALSLLSLITPFIVVAGFYVMDRDLGLLLSDFTDNLFNDNSVYKFDRVTVVVLIYAALILLISLGFLSNQAECKEIKARKTYFLLFWAFGISLVLYFYCRQYQLR